MSAIQTTLKAQKRVLRSAITTKLATIPPRSIQEQTHAIIKRLTSFPAFQCAKSLSCYLSMPSGEVDTTSLVSEVLESGGIRAHIYVYIHVCDDESQGRTLFVPRIINRSGEMDFLKLYNKDDLATLPSGTWGIKEPDFDWHGKPRPRALETPDLDLILLPAVAFDRSFARLGHGKGYYDRFITSYQSTFRKRPLLVGLALREQLLEMEGVPMDKHDWSMDYIVTPDAVLTNPSTASRDQPEST